MMSFSREWDRAVDGSPNRHDAMTRVLTRLSKNKASFFATLTRRRPKRGVFHCFSSFS
jgi:hypothetical protein